MENVPLITLAELAMVEKGLELDHLFGACLLSTTQVVLKS